MSKRRARCHFGNVFKSATLKYGEGERAGEGVGADGGDAGMGLKMDGEEGVLCEIFRCGIFLPQSLDLLSAISPAMPP